MKKTREVGGRHLQTGEYYHKKKNLYSYSYTTRGGKRKSVYGKTLKELRDKEDMIKVSNGKLDSALANSITLNTLFDKRMKEESEVLRDTTQANYHYLYDQYVRDSFGRKKICAVISKDIEYYYQALINERGVSIATVENIDTLFKPLFKSAVQDNLVSYNALTGVIRKIKKQNKYERTHKESLTKAEQQAFLKFICENEQYQNWRGIMLTLFGTGARVGEVTALTWDDVDFDKEEIRIERTVSYFQDYGGTKKCNYTINDAKTKAGRRTIAMLMGVKQALEQERSFQEMTGLKCTQAIGNCSGFVFANRNGNIHKGSTINSAIKRIVRAYNREEETRAEEEGRAPVFIRDFSCHIIRHSFATRMVEVNANPKWLQAHMGHKDIKTTLNYYVDVHEEMRHAEARRIEKLIGFM